MMKRIVIAAIALMATQQVKAQHVSLGPAIGFGDAWMSNMDNVQFKPTFNVGATFIYSVVPHFGIGADLRVHFMEGVAEKTTMGSIVEKTSLNATYLRLPIKFIYFFGQYGDRLRPKLYVGPSFGVLLGGKTISKQENPDYRTEINTTDVLNSFDFGLMAGAGLNWRLHKATWLNLDLIYTHGLTDAGKMDGYQANRNFGISAGITFPVGAKPKPATK